MGSQCEHGSNSTRGPSASARFARFPRLGEASCIGASVRQGAPRYFFLTQKSALELKSIFSSSDARYLLLGGQHVTAALYTLAAKLTSEGQPLPPSYQRVRAVVLRRNTPTRLCRQAAGAHQAVQENNKAVEIQDVLLAIGRCCMERYVLKGQTFLTDDQLGAVLQSQGLVKGIGEKTTASDAVSVSKALERQQQEVFLHACCTINVCWCPMSFTVEELGPLLEIHPLLHRIQLEPTERPL